MCFPQVVPQWTEVAQITSRGFKLLDGPFDHAFFDGGYGAVYTPELLLNLSSSSGGDAPRTTGHYYAEEQYGDDGALATSA